jgi:hypothetical protein
MTLTPTTDLFAFLGKRSSQGLSPMALLVASAAIFARLRTVSNRPKELTNPSSSIREDVRNRTRLRASVQAGSGAALPLSLQMMDDSILLLASLYPADSTTLEASPAPDYFSRARYDATNLLATVCKHNQRPGNACSSCDPLITLAIALAFDTLTSYGLLSTLTNHNTHNRGGNPTFMSLVTQAIGFMSAVEQHSPMAKAQNSAMKKRLAAVMAQGNTTTDWRKSGWWFDEDIYGNRRSKRPEDILSHLRRKDIAQALGLKEDDIMDMRHEL